jgi:hypothetical protein
LELSENATHVRSGNTTQPITTTSMSIVEKFAELFTTEPQKSFKKAGITDAQGVLTDVGSKIYLTYLLNSDDGGFKTKIVDELLKKEE